MLPTVVVGAPGAANDQIINTTNPKTIFMNGPAKLVASFLPTLASWNCVSRGAINNSVPFCSMIVAS